MTRERSVVSHPIVATTFAPSPSPTDPPRRVDQTSYRYDGQGRLVALSEASAERVWLGGYEVSDALVWDGVWGLGEDPSRVSGQAMTLRFAGWRGDGLGAGSSREVVTVSPALSVVKTGRPNSGGAQFFINTAHNRFLDWWDQQTPSQHPVFGKIAEGMDVVSKIEGLGSRSGQPSKPVQMVSITIDRRSDRCRQRPRPRAPLWGVGGAMVAGLP